jgi:hypothetical protein
MFTSGRTSSRLLPRSNSDGVEMQQRAVTDGILFRPLQASYSLQGVISHLGSSPSSGAPAL